MACSWQRIEPGFYRLRGTDWYVANMKGQSVMWSGIVMRPWVARRGTETITRFDTKIEAQRWVEAQVTTVR
jgi:hypothetical protein